MKQLTLLLGFISIVHFSFATGGNESENEKESVATLDITPDEDNERRRIKTRHNFHLELGFNNYLNNGSFPRNDFELTTLGSRYLAIASTFDSKITQKFSIEYGGSINWYNFKFQNEDLRLERIGDQVAFVDQGVEDSRRSRLSNIYANIVVVPTLSFGKSKSYSDHSRWRWKSHEKGFFRVGLGGYVGYRLLSTSTFVFRQDGDKERDRNRDSFLQSNLRYGARLQLGIRKIDLFAQYDFNDLFRPNSGAPELNALSFGFIF